MAPKDGALRYGGGAARRRRWVMLVGGAFTLYCMFLFQVRLWSAASHADLGANVVSGGIDRPAVKLEEGRQRAAREDVEVSERPRHMQTPRPTRGADGRQNLRAADPPLSIPGAVVVSAPEPSVTRAAAPVVAATAPVPSLTGRHDEVAGYDAAMEYLANYTTPEGSDEQLFLFFVCGDENGQQTAWRRVCADASERVYDVFAKSPSRNRLLTVRAGSKQYWSQSNAFFKDVDLKVKMIPALMQWHGGLPGAKRATSGMILEESLLYEPLLRYLFKNEDVSDPLLAPEKIADKEIVLLKGYKNYRLYMDAISAGENPSPTGPMFLFLVAGRLESNDRLWCPYCRYSEASVEYAFYAFAPQGSRLVKVETVNSYGEWKNPKNDWKQDTSLMVRGVPWMYRAKLDSDAHEFTFERVSERFDHPDKLRGIFQGWKNAV
jgi:hypothetical protein